MHTQPDLTIYYYTINAYDSISKTNWLNNYDIRQRQRSPILFKVKLMI